MIQTQQTTTQSNGAHDSGSPESDPADAKILRGLSIFKEDGKTLKTKPVPEPESAPEVKTRASAWPASFEVDEDDDTLPTFESSSKRRLSLSERSKKPGFVRATKSTTALKASKSPPFMRS